MRQNAIIGALTVIVVILMALSTIPAVTSDTSSSGGSRGVDWDDNIAPQATPGGSGSPFSVNLWNDNILTGQNAFVWCNGLGTDNSWMEYTWPTEVTIGGFGIHQFRPSGTRQLIGCNEMQYWDGSQYIGIGGYHAINENIYTVGQPYYKELDSTITTTKFRLFNLLGYAWPSGQVSNPSVSEWQVFSGTGGIPAEVQVKPSNLHFNSNAKYLNVRVLDFPEDPDKSPVDIDGETVKVENVGTFLKFNKNVDSKFMGKVDRQIIMDAIGTPGNQIELEVSGKLNDGTGFSGIVYVKASQMDGDEYIIRIISLFFF